LSETCFRLVGNLSETCRKHVADYVENVFSTCFRQDRSNGIWPLLTTVASRRPATLRSKFCLLRLAEWLSQAKCQYYITLQ